MRRGVSGPPFKDWPGDLTMRRIVFLGMAVACMGAWAGVESGGGVVHLDSAASLAQLRATNPVHYARAQKILAAANHLCRPTAGEVQYADFGAKDISCARSFVKTSNPPKREIRFRLDDTRYVALVILTDDPAKLVAAGLPR
jgi:hypothetical protein